MIFSDSVMAAKARVALSTFAPTATKNDIATDRPNDDLDMQNLLGVITLYNRVRILILGQVFGDSLELQNGLKCLCFPDNIPGAVMNQDFRGQFTGIVV